MDKKAWGGTCCHYFKASKCLMVAYLKNLTFGKLRGILDGIRGHIARQSTTNGEGSQYGIFKSVDGGETWQKKVNGISLIDESIETNLVFRGFTVQKGNSEIVYSQAEVSTTEDGLEFNRVKGRVYKSINGGDTWSLIWSGNNLARYLIIDHSNSNTLYLSTGIFDREAYNSDCENGIAGGEGILKSYDAGETWGHINEGLTDLYVGSLRMHPTNNQILFAATGNNACSRDENNENTGGLFKTENAGATWTQVIRNGGLSTVNYSPSNPDIMYAGGTFEFYRSENGGGAWERFAKEIGWQWGPPGVVAGFPIDMVVDPNNPYLLYANNYGGGVFRSVSGAESWESWTNGISGAELHDLFVPSENTNQIYVIGRSGPFVSNTYGDDWIGIANGEAIGAEWYAIAMHPQNTNVILVSEEFEGTLYRSTNYGNHFAEIFRHPAIVDWNPDNRQGFKTIVFPISNQHIVYAGISKDRITFETSSPIGTVIYKSIDSGETFSPMSSILDGHNINELVVDENNEDIVYAATTNGIYKSNDGALNWQYCTNLGNRHIESLVLDPDQTGYIVAGEGYLGSGVWISHDDGATWSGPHNTGFNSANPYISAVIKDPNNSKTYFASDLYSGVYRSEDNGLTWAAFPDWRMPGLTYRAVKDIAMNEKVLYAATDGGGVFRYMLDSTETEDELPVINSFTVSSETTNISAPISFNCDAFDPDGGDISYYFDFGDGSSKTDYNNSVEHSYDSNGAYFAECSVTDDEGNTQTSSSIEINVLSNIIVLTDESEPLDLPSGQDVEVYGSTGSNTINVQTNSHLQFLNCSGSNLINIEEASSAFSIYRSGATVYLSSSEGTSIMLSATLTKQTLRFADGSSELSIIDGDIVFGNQIVSLTSSNVESPVEQTDSTVDIFQRL